eukprot:2863663-Pyramimonas_sp.AAC.1
MLRQLPRRMHTAPRMPHPVSSSRSNEPPLCTQSRPVHSIGGKVARALICCVAIATELSCTARLMGSLFVARCSATICGSA